MMKMGLEYTQRTVPTLLKKEISLYMKKENDLLEETLSIAENG